MVEKNANNLEHTREMEMEMNTEKPFVQQQPDPDADEEFSYAEQRKIIHKVDRRLLIIAGLMQAVSFLDRANMSNAAVAGMTAELNMEVGNRYVSCHKVHSSRVQGLSRCLVDYPARLFRPVYHLRVPCHNCSPQDRSAQVSLHDCLSLGNHHDGTLSASMPHHLGTDNDSASASCNPGSP